MNFFKEELDQLKKQGLLRTLTTKENSPELNLSSNDYLGLSHHPDVVQAAAAALDQFGCGGTSSRLLAGTLSLHREVEESLAKFLFKDAVLVFSSGYHANTGIIPVVAGAGDIIFMDRLCHASIVDGVKLSDARFATFNHNDVKDLEKLIQTRRSAYKKAIVILEGVFSMDGDVPPLRDIVQLAQRHDCLVYLDEAHSFGVFGPDGRGLAASIGLLDQIDIFVGTLSKTLGSQGGFVATSQALVDLLVSRCRSFIYTTALAPAAAAGALAALKLLPHMEYRRKIILNEAQDLRRHLQNLEFSVLKSASQIIPVWTGDIDATKKLSDHLKSQGFFVPSIRPPTVPVGEGRVRLSISYDAVQKGLDGLMKAFENYPDISRRELKKIVQAS